MKTLIVVAVLAGSVSCRKPPAALQQPVLPLAGKDWYPLAHGNSWTYASHFVMGDSPEEGRKTFNATSDGGAGFRIEEAGKGILNAVTMLYAATEAGVTTRSGMLGASKTAFDPPLVELPASMAAGASWTWTGSSSGRPLSFTNVFEGMESVTVPAGTYRCARVRRKTPTGVEIVHWYGEKVGVVKMEVKRPPMGIAPKTSEVMELSAVTVK